MLRISFSSSAIIDPDSPTNIEQREGRYGCLKEGSRKTDKTFKFNATIAIGNPGSAL